VTADRFDCLVVGAGPAGSSAAEALAAAGLSACLIEKQRLPRAKVCAGGLPPKALALLPEDLGGIPRRAVRAVRFTHDGQHEFIHRADSPLITVVQRSAFDEWLARRAVAAGAELREEVTCRAIHAEEDGVSAETTAGAIRARAAVLATGATGQVELPHRLMDRSRLGTALQAEIPFDGSGELAEAIGCDFGMDPCQIAWSFPGPGHLAVGVLSFRLRTHGLMTCLHQHLRRLGLEAGEGQIQGGTLAVWRGQRRFSTHRILLAGDAAGLVNPLTGAGIRRAILSGRLAARTIAENLDQGRDPGHGFDRAMRQTFAPGFSRAAAVAKAFYAAPGLWYRLAVTTGRGTNLMERLLSGRASYDHLFWELLRGKR
jgi:geranylgeranyl reductase family protein